MPPEIKTGRPRTVNMMLVIQGILYVLVSSCAWRLMPKEYPPSSTVYYYFSKWSKDGTRTRVHDHLVGWVRVAEDRNPSPSVASLDSQTVPTAVMVSDSVGYDAGKKTKGRKRFTMVDTLGLLLIVKVVAADVPEREGAKQLLTKMNEERHRVPRLTRIWFDGGFSGPDFLHWVMDICHWIAESFRSGSPTMEKTQAVDVVLRPNGSKGFVLLPKRWTVERTYGCQHQSLWC
ncbi:IS5 family transposase [Chamaesiphon sp. VAR_48_metabat_135_sub]|uniref:IS5 family transposase n=1 Tax=Chamaesiphon sp. VAR_48_metabat_135_sub TaxID=2964699 RepID=UPI0037BF6FF1